MFSYSFWSFFHYIFLQEIIFSGGFISKFVGIFNLIIIINDLLHELDQFL